MSKQWIAVADRVPKKYESVLIFYKGKMSRVKKKVTEGWWNGEYWDCFAILNGLNENISVTHWQPLPESPKTTKP